MLNRNIQIFHDLRLLGHGLDKLVVDLVGVNIVNTDPVKSFDLAQLMEQLGQQALMSRQVGAVAAGVLRHHNQLLHTGIGQHPGLVEHIVQLSAAIFAPQRWDHAVGAVIVAALCDFDVRIVLGGRKDTPGLFLRGVDGAKIRYALFLQQAFNGWDDLGIAPGAQHAVHLRHLLHDLVLVALGQAAGDQDLADPALCLQRSRHKNMVDRLGLSGINEAAGIDHNHIAAVDLTADGIACLLDAVHHSLAIYLIFGTAKRNKTNHCHLLNLRKIIGIKRKII